MTEPPTLPQIPRASHWQRWLRLLMALMLFFCGGVVGGIVGARLQHQTTMAMLNANDPLADHVMPSLRAKLDLTDEQTEQIQKIIRRRQAAMQAIRAEYHPYLLSEWQGMRKDIDAKLLGAQKQQSTSLFDTLEKRFLPVPLGPPPADLLFKNFDADKDGALSKTEVFFGMWLRLQRADANNDGKVTRQEYDAARR